MTLTPRIRRTHHSRCRCPRTTFFRFGSIATEMGCPRYVRFSPESDCDNESGAKSCRSFHAMSTTLIVRNERNQRGIHEACPILMRHGPSPSVGHWVEPRRGEGKNEEARSAVRRTEDQSFLLLVLAATLAFARILQPFYGAVLWAIVGAVIFAPVNRELLRSTRGRPNLAA